MRDPQSARARHAGFPADFVPFDETEIEQSIPARFERIVATYPDRLAVKAGRRTWTYAQLNAAANRVAHALLERGGPGAEPVPLLLEHGAPFIPALLGSLKAGKCYVPLDLTLPRPRLAEMLADLEARVVLTNTANASMARDLIGRGGEVIDVDMLPERLSRDNPAVAIAPDACAYVIYTSGSTGAPKGVVTDHRVALHYTMNYTNSVRYGKQDRVSWLNALTANATVSDIYPALLNGGAVFPFSVGEEGIERLAAWLAEEEITSYGSVPVIFRRLAAVVSHPDQLPRLRLVRLGGDRLLRSDVELFTQRFSPRCLLRNGMGAAEVLLVRQFFLDRETEVTTHVVPVGYALPDVAVVIVDDEHRPVGAGEVGEIAVKSRYLAQGYWRRPDLTAARFLEAADPGGERVYLTGDLGRLLPDGCLIHLGRTDFQVKVRGKLVAPAEVENALLDLPAVKETVVMPYEDETGETRLAAYLVPTRQPPPAASELRRALGERLPAQMIPSAFVVLDALPLTANSKVDRRALPAPAPGRPRLGTPFVAPRTSIEQALASIWSEVLRIDDIGAHDDFRDLGGDSLLATQVVSRVTARFAVSVPLRTLLGAPTVAEMAALMPAPVVTGTRRASPGLEPLAHGFLQPAENPLEVQLAAIWEAVLARRPVGRRDSFFDVGGHPGLAVRMLAEVEQALGERVPLPDLLEEPTIEHLASVIVRRGTEGFHALVTTVQPGAARTPFFLFHGDYRGGGFFCRPLARALGADLPVHALHPHGLNGRPVPRTIEAMAEDFLPAIRRLQPHGPYILGGYCNGGVVAYEAAQRLRAAGEEVALLVMLDAAVSGYRHRHAHAALARIGVWRGWSAERRDDAFLRYREWRDHLGHRVRAVGRRADRVRRAGLRGVLAAVAARMPRRAASPPPALRPATVPAAPDLDNDFRRALWRYMPRRFPGRVVAFVAAEGLRQTLGADLGWRALAPALTLHDVPGDHGECLTRHQSVLAAALRRHLDEADPPR